MMRKMIGDGYKRRNETEADFSFVHSNDDVLNICKTYNILEYVKRQQAKYLAHIQ